MLAQLMGITSLAALAALSLGTLRAADDWHSVKSNDGKVQAMMPGEAKKSTIETKSAAGKVTTYNMEFHGDQVQFDISYSKIPRLALKFASEDKIFDNARGSVLHKAFGKESSFEKVTISGNSARELKYEGVSHDDPDHGGFQGTTLFFMVDGTLYVANAVVAKGADGDADLKKFRASIVISD